MKHVRIVTLQIAIKFYTGIIIHHLQGHVGVSNSVQTGKLGLFHITALCAYACGRVGLLPLDT